MGAFTRDWAERMCEDVMTAFWSAISVATPEAFMSRAKPARPRRDRD